MTVLSASFGKEGELGRMPPTANCTELADEVSFTHHVAFDPEGPARGGKVVGELERCRKSVREEVVPEFVDLFPS
jgi:hypothetical protein